MTVSALVTRNDITATASQTSFTYTFRVLEATDMDVYQNGALLASGYTVNDVGVTTGGTVTLDVGVPVGQIVSLVLAMPLDRTTNYQNSGDFLAGDVNGDFDKIYIGAIQNENEGGRSLRLQDVEPPTAGVDMTIPLKADRLGKYLAFNATTGAPEVVAGISASTNASLVTYDPSGAGAVATTVQAKLRESVSVKDFGATGDGVTDDTAAIQAAIDACVLGTQHLIIPAGTFIVSSLSVANGILGISGEGVIKGLGTASVATIVIGSSGSGVVGATFSLKMNQSNGDLVAIRANDTVDCSFKNCEIYGFINSATTNHYAFWVVGTCSRNIFTENNITLYDTPTQRGFGIAIYGPEGAEPYAGFFTGVFAPSSAPAKENVISSNIIIDGSYAISLQYTEESAVDSNVCRNQNHRSVYCAVGSLRNVISNNVFIEYLSTAVLLGYNAWYNVIIGNSCYTTIWGGEAAINVNTGSSYNLISGNDIDSPTNFGIYLGADMRSNVVQGNSVRNHYVAGIALDNDFIVRPANSFYSRPNYAAPIAPYTSFSQVDSTDNVIQNNTISYGYTGRNTASIAVSQLDGPNTTSILRTTIAGNNVISANDTAYNLWFYADTAGRFLDTVVSNNMLNSGNADASFDSTGATTWAERISYYADNKELDEIINGEPINFTDADTTPSVITNSSVPSERLYQFSNTGATSVTDFDDPYSNQEITLRMDANTTIIYDSAKIRTKGDANVTGSANNFIQFMHLPNGIWYETWRSF